MTLIEKVFPPYPKKKMLKEQPRNTICETLRLAYKCIDNEEYEKAKYKLRIAVTMAKRMNAKLESYHSGYGEDFFPLKD